ncbi:MAG: mechanosensitive ion channel domain-containing protein [Bacteroidota bacterium]
MCVTTVLIALESIGIQLSVLWGGAAALMVGIGLGLQQTFNDVISGLILLVEGTIEVDDVVEVDGFVGKVKSIGLRTSKVETRNRISILVPNSKLVGENTINWTHNQHPIRFQVSVGVAYASDVELVTQLLLEAAHGHSSVLKEPEPMVQFLDFGNSSLDFILHFFSYEQMSIEIVKSDLRYRITRLFREHDVEIPFPQQDLWLRNAEVLQKPAKDVLS